MTTVVDSGASRPVHPVAAIFPLLSGEELADLAADIAEHGLLQPIVLDAAGRVLDGRNRLAACAMANVAPRFATYEGDDPTGYALSVNITRRHLGKGQRAMIAAKARRIETIQTPVRRAAEDAAVSHGLISHAAVVLDYAPDLADQVIADVVSLDAAYRVALSNKALLHAMHKERERLLNRQPVEAWEEEPVAARAGSSEHEGFSDGSTTDPNPDAHVDAQQTTVAESLRSGAPAVLKQSSETVAPQPRGAAPTQVEPVGPSQHTTVAKGALAIVPEPVVPAPAVGLEEQQRPAEGLQLALEEIRQEVAASRPGEARGAAVILPKEPVMGQVSAALGQQLHFARPLSDIATEILAVATKMQALEAEAATAATGDWASFMLPGIRDSVKTIAEGIEVAAKSAGAIMKHYNTALAQSRCLRLVANGEE